MILINRHDVPTPISCLSDAKKMDGFWYYDLQKQDFFCGNMTTVVELQASALTVSVDNNMVHLPVEWYTIVCDKMSGSIDTIPVHELTNTNFKLFVVGPTHKVVTETGYRVVNFDNCRTFFYPSFTKQQLLCIAATPSKWIFATPIDTYQKYIKRMCPADLMI